MKTIKFILTPFIALLIIFGGYLPAQATTATDAYNQLSVARNNAGKATPANDASLRSLAHDRAKQLASKDGGAPVAGLPSTLTSKGYKQSRQLYGFHSSGDAQGVIDLWLSDKPTKSIIIGSQWNRLGVGTSKSKTGKVYVVAILAEYKAPVKATPKPVVTAKPKAPAQSTSNGGGTTSTEKSDAATSPTSTQSQAEAKAQKELAELKSKQKKEAEARAKQEAEAQKKAEEEKKRKQEEAAKAKAEQEEKEAEQRALAEREKLEREQAEKERIQEIQRLAQEKKDAEQRAAKFKAELRQATGYAGNGSLAAGLFMLPVTLLITRKKKSIPVPAEGGEEWERFKKKYIAEHKDDESL